MLNLWDQLQHCDFHLHTCFSDGQGTPQELLQACLTAGLRRIAITDHCEFGHPRDMSARWPEYVHTLKQLRTYAEQQGAELLIGIETGIDANGHVKAPAEVVSAADLVIASVHNVNLHAGEEAATIGSEPYWERYREQLMRTACSTDVDVIGHIEGYIVAHWSCQVGRTFADRRRIEKELAITHFPLAWYAELAENAAANGVAVELHGLSESPRPEVVRILKKNGVKFSLGSDAHVLEHVAHLGYVKRLIDELHLEAADFASFVGLNR